MNLTCRVYWKFLQEPPPVGLGLIHLDRCRESALILLRGMNEDDIVALACGLYSLYRTVNHGRHVPPRANEDIKFAKMLKLFSKRARKQPLPGINVV